MWKILIILVAWSQISLGLTIDQTIVSDRSSPSSTISTNAFSTTQPNELLLALICADNVSSAPTIVTGVTGDGGAWVLVHRTNTQRGTAEIWKCLAVAQQSNVTITATLSQSVYASITVMSFSGVDMVTGTGATGTANSISGLPTGFLTTTRDGSIVLGVGNDWDNAIPRTVASGQVMIHQYLSPVGDTYWSQMQSAPTPSAGTVVEINDTAPSTDRYDLSMVEILNSTLPTPTPSPSATPTPSPTSTPSPSPSPTATPAPTPSPLPPPTPPPPPTPTATPTPNPTPTPSPTPNPVTLAPIASVTLAWNVDTDPTVAGYNLYYGTLSGAENTKVVVGNFNGQRVALPTGATYFFIVKSYNAAGIESVASNEVSAAL